MKAFRVLRSASHGKRSWRVLLVLAVAMLLGGVPGAAEPAKGTLWMLPPVASNSPVGSRVVLGLTLWEIGGHPVRIRSITVVGDPQFTLERGCSAMLGASGSCDIGLRFAPTNAGTFSGTLRIDSDASNDPYEVRLSGSGSLVEPWGPQISPRMADLGTMDAHAVGPWHTFEVEVDWPDKEVWVTGLDILGGNLFDFDVEDIDCAGTYVSPSRGCTFRVRFQSSSDGPKVLRIRLQTLLPYRAELTVFGNGFVPAPSLSVSPGSLDFGARSVGSLADSTPREVEVTNRGWDDLTFDSIAIVAGESGFVRETPGLDPCLPGVPVLALGRCTISIRLMPLVPGAHRATLAIRTNGGDASIDLSGYVRRPASLAAEPASHDFGRHRQGAMGAWQHHTFKVTNDGEDTATVTSAGLSGGTGFAVDMGQTTCHASVTLDPAAWCTVAIQTSSATAGSHTASYDIGYGSETLSIGLVSVIEPDPTPSADPTPRADPTPSASPEPAHGPVMDSVILRPVDTNVAPAGRYLTRVTWTASGSETSTAAGISYEVAVREPGQARWSVRYRGPATSADVRTAQGLTRVRVTAIQDGIRGPSVIARANRHVLNVGWLHPRGVTWLLRPRAGSVGRDVLVAFGKGAHARFRIPPSREIALVARRTSRSGRIQVLVNGRKVATVNLASDETRLRAIVWQQRWADRRSRTVEIRVVSGRADLDAFILTR